MCSPADGFIKVSDIRREDKFFNEWRIVLREIAQGMAILPALNVTDWA